MSNGFTDCAVILVFMAYRMWHRCLDDGKLRLNVCLFV